MRHIYLLTLLIFIGFTANAQVGIFSNNQWPNSVCIDGQATNVTSVSFNQSTFTQGCEVSDIEVRIDWTKTDGTCSNPTGGGNSFHSETSFRLEAPDINQSLAVPGTWSGSASSGNSVVTTFVDGSTISPGPGSPFGPAGNGTFNSNPNNAGNSMDNFIGTSALGNWRLIAQDAASLDPLLVGYARVRVTTTPDNTGPTITLTVPGATEVSPGVFEIDASSGQCGRTVTHSATADDLCGVTSLQYVGGGGTTSGSFFAVGDHTLSYQATDSYNNSPVRSFTLRIVDNEDPSVSCPANVSVNAASGQCTAAVNSLAPTVGDNCGVSSTTYSLSGATTGSGVNDASGLTFNVGTTTVTYNVEDVNGNTNTCSFTVTVTDAQTPTISCPSNISVNNDNGVCGAAVSFTVSEGDNCSAVVSVPSGQTLGSGDVFPVGTTSLTYIATDPAGNSASCSFDITVTDIEAPSITCPTNITVSNDAGVCGATIPWTAPTGTDNCPGAVTTQTAGPTTSPNLFSIGTTTLSYTVTDAASLTASCSFTVTVNDTELPSISCPSNITVGVDAGDCGAVVNYMAPVGTDNCSAGVTTSLTSGVGTEDGAFFNVGTTTVSYEVEDASSNTNQCSFDVIVNDDEAPTFPLCPSDTVWANTASGSCDATVSFAVLAQDNCPGLTTAPAVPQGSGTVFSLGSTDVSITATDAAGNSTDCAFTVTVVDNEFPIVSCLISEENVTFPNCEYIVPDYIGQSQVNASDNCSGLVTSQAPVPGTIVTESTLVVLTGTDASGNESSCAITINPLDLYPPVINNCPTRDLVDVSSGDCSFIIPEYDQASLNVTDSCNTTLTFTQTPFPGTVSTLDSVLVTIDVSDGTNVSTCSFYAVGEDVTAPSIDCPADRTESVDANCDFTIPSYVSNVSSLNDNCSDNANIDVAQATIGTVISGAGTTQTIELIATDEAGNQASCSFVVTLEDNIAPTLVCPVTITRDFNANCQYVIQDLTNLVTGEADNCTASGSLIVSQSPSAGTSIGATSSTVTFTVTDESGNSTDCSSNLVVQDVTAPIANCPTDQVEDVDAACEIQLPDYTSLVTVTDNCPSLSTVTVTQGAPTAPGTTVEIADSPVTVQMTVSDGTNASNCSFDVVLQDVTAPTLACPTATPLSADNNCEASAPNYASQVPGEAGTSDNCTANLSLVMSQSPAVGDALSVGVNTITVTGTDAAGNSSTCTVSVLVEDNNNPTIACPSYTVSEVADASCQVTIDDYRSLVTASDFCDQNLTLTQSPAAGTLGAANASPTVTITATDDSNNSSNCTITVVNIDETNPTITCPGNPTVNPDANCEYLLANYTGLASTGDNCDVSVDVTQSPAVNTLNSGNTTVTLTATDDAGNISTCTFEVESVDNTDPGITCPSNQEVSSSIVGGNCIFIIPDLTGSATVSDNCTSTALVGVTQAPTSGTVMSADETITLTATDAAGNTATCTFDLLLNDDAAPSITCPGDFDVDVDANCEYAVTSYTNLATASDNCSSAPTVTQVVTPNVTSLSATESLLVTLTATDDSLNAASCDFTITAVDVTGPVVNCPTVNDTVSANGSCLVALPDYTGSYVAVDNCDATITNLSQVPSAGTAIVDSVQVTLSATDNAGNAGDCSFWVIREDDTPPTIISCPTAVQYIETDASCQYTIPDLTNLVLVDDNCDDNLTLTQASIGSTGSGLGQTTVEVVVTDSDGNESTCQLNIAGEDVLPPILTCPQDDVVAAGANCNYSLQSYNALYSDNCTSVATTTSQSPSAGLIGVGITTVVLSATDASGNTGTCSFTLEVEDNTAPFILGCPSDISVENDLSICGAVVNYSEINAFDNCASFISLQLDEGQASGTVFPVDTTQVVWIADDGNGNTTNCEFEVIVTDTEDPIIVCPANITQNIDAGTCQAQVTYSLPTVNDNCTNPITPMLVSGGASGSIFLEGVNTVTYEAEDEYGNTADCSFTVTVVDNEAPVITCPADITVSNDPGSCDAVVNYPLPTVVDNCTNPITPILTLGIPTGGTFPLGTTVLRYRAEDASGNSALCSFTVTVEDDEDPVLTCPNDTSINCDAPVVYDDAVASDNCTQFVTVTELPNNGFVLGPNTVTFEANDGNGNITNCDFTVTIIDTVAPVIDVCPGNQLELFDASCNLILPDYTGLITATDNCDTPVVTQVPAVSDVVTGLTEVTLTASDVSGNTSTCVFDVIDNAPPTIVCPANDTVGSDINCEYTLLDYTALATAADNCGGVAVTQDLVVGDLIGGQTTITLTATDDFGNTATCDFDIVPVDNIDPSITCIGNQTVAADANCEFVLADYTSSIITDDNCDASPQLTQLPAPGSTIAGLGANTIVVTAIDAAGNENSCSFSVSPIDNLSPTITCPGTQVELADANCEIALSDYTTLATTDDACDAASVVVSQSPAIGSLQGGSTLVTLTATDGSGNSSSCAFLVESEDQVQPTIACPTDLEVDVDANCEYALMDYTSLGTPADNCATQFVVTQSPTVGTPISSVTQIELTANDGNGNTGTCVFNVTPVDNTPPTITCAPDQQVSFDSNCQFEVGDYNGLAVVSDNCTTPNDVVISQVPAAGSFISGASPVTLTATDGAGNTWSCDFMLMPSDDEAPVLTCPVTQDVSFNSNCEYELLDYTTAALVNDNCSSPTVTQDVLVGAIITSTTTVTLTASDNDGNSMSCSFDVVPADNTNPSLACPSDQLIDFDGDCQFEMGDYKNITTYDDNCGPVSIVQTPAVGSIWTGQTTVTMTVSDPSGNEVDCSFEVIPSDNTLPVLSCPGDQVAVLDENCQATMEDYSTVAIYSDNCTALPEFGQFPPAGTIITIDTEVSLTVEDDAGNSTDCSFIIAVDDTTSPEIVECPVDVVVSLNANCAYSVPDYTGQMQATDNCDATLDYQQLPIAGFEITGVDTITVQVAAIDDAGNAAICTFELQTSDDADPVITCPDNQTLQLSANCNYEVPDYTSLAVANDACGTTTITQSPLAGSIITSQLNATLIVEDADGNTATCTFFVNIEEFEVEVSGTDVSCDGGSDGSASVIISGGTPPYTQDWGGFDPSALAEGFYTVTVTDANGCSVVGDVTISAAGTFDLTLSPSGDVEICDGTSLVIDAGAGYADYDWSTGASVSSITVSAEGDYWIAVTNAQGCVAYDTVSVSFYETIAPDITLDNDGVLYSSNDTAQSYQWYLDGQPIADATNPYYCPTENGNYQVEIVDDNGCSVISGINEHTYDDNSLCATGIDEYGLSMDVYPNPSDGTFMLTYSLDANRDIELSVVDLMGRQVTDAMQLNGLSGNQALDLSSEADGIYILRIVVDNQHILQQRLMLVK